MNILVDLYFLEADCQKMGISFSWGGFDHHRNYGMVVILLSFFCSYDNLTLKLHQGKHATLMMDSILLAYSKMEVYQEWVLLLKYLKKFIMSMMQGHL